MAGGSASASAAATATAAAAKAQAAEGKQAGIASSAFSRVSGSLELVWRAFGLMKGYPFLFLLFAGEFVTIGLFTHQFFFARAPLQGLFSGGTYGFLRPVLFFAWAVSFIIIIFNGLGVFVLYKLAGGRKKLSFLSLLIALPAQVIYSLVMMLLTVSVQIVARAFNKGKFDLESYLGNFGVAASGPIGPGLKAAEAVANNAAVGPNLRPHQLLLKVLYELWSGITYFTNQAMVIERRNFFASVDRSVEITKNCFAEVITGHIIYSSLLYVYGTVLVVAVTASALVGVMLKVSPVQMVDLLKFFAVFWGLLILLFYTYLAQSYFTMVYVWNEDLEEARKKDPSASLSQIPLPDAFAGAKKS